MSDTRILLEGDNIHTFKCQRRGESPASCRGGWVSHHMARVRARACTGDGFGSLHEGMHFLWLWGVEARSYKGQASSTLSYIPVLTGLYHAAHTHVCVCVFVHMPCVGEGLEVRTWAGIPGRWFAGAFFFLSVSADDFFSFWLENMFCIYNKGKIQ